MKVLIMVLLASMLVSLSGCAGFGAQKAGEETYAACMNAGNDSYYCHKEASAAYDRVVARNQSAYKDYAKSRDEREARDAERNAAYIESIGRRNE